MTPTAQTPPAEWLPRGLAALDERFAKAKAEKFTVKVVADRKFAVTNGEGGAYEVDFTATNTGVCNCPDFQSRGSLLHACRVGGLRPQAHGADRAGAVAGSLRAVPGQGA